MDIRCIFCLEACKLSTIYGRYVCTSSDCFCDDWWYFRLKGVDYCAPRCIPDSLEKAPIYTSNTWRADLYELDYNYVIEY